MPTQIPTVYDARRGIRNWQWLGNMYLGDCVIAAFLHILMIHNLSSLSSWQKLKYRLGFKIPTDNFAKNLYKDYLATLNEVPSGTQGVDPNAFFIWCKENNTIKDFKFVPFDTDWNTTVRIATVAGIGALTVMNLTQRAYNSYWHHEAWDIKPGEVPDPQLAHAVASVAFATNIGNVTWNQMKSMTPEFANACVTGVWIFE